MLTRRLPLSVQAAALLSALMALMLPQEVLAYTGILSALPTQVLATDCAGTAEFCVSAAPETTLTANGRALAPSETCAERTFVSLDLSKAFEGLGSGPYEVAWRVTPGTFRKRLATRDSLLAFLRTSAPEAEWRRGTKGQLVGLPNDRYGEILIVDAISAASTKTAFEKVRLATDQTYRLSVGTYQLIATSPDGADSSVLHVHCTPLERRDVTVLKDIKGLHCLQGEEPADTYTLSVVQTPSVVNVGPLGLLGVCIEFSGVAVGTTIGVFERCHTPTGTCERFEITFKVTSAGRAAKPLPKGDYAALAWNGQGLIEVLANDQLEGDVSSLVISAQSRGAARIDARNRIHYDAPEDWCGNDSLSYIVCTASGCEEAAVKIQVSCEKLIVFTGFSPNGDGVNDHFTVLGLENHPDNQLVIFNEYGHEVFTKTGYTNDWAGVSHGSLLSTGTYYYVLTVKNYAMLSGYVQLQR